MTQALHRLVRRLIRRSVNRSRGGNAGRANLMRPAPLANHAVLTCSFNIEAIMNTAIQTPDNMASGQAHPSSGNKPLWAAVGLLSAAVLAMGGTMLYRQGAQSAVTAAPVAALAAPAVPAALQREKSCGQTRASSCTSAALCERFASTSGSVLPKQ